MAPPLIPGIAAIDDVEAFGLRGRPQLPGFRVVAGGHGGFDGDALGYVEMDVPFGGAAPGIGPEGPGPFGRGGREAAIHGGQAA